MAEVKNLARVLLRPDGSVHIAFRDFRSIYATAENLSQLFSDPIDFIESGSLKHKDSGMVINRKRVALEDVLGLTLATINSDKQIVCDFPELFQFLFTAKADEKQKSKPLDMKSLELEMSLSDEKSYLLRYYLELTNYFKSAPAIKTNIKLRDEVQFAIIKEILNTFFDEELPPPSPTLALSEQIDQIESDLLLKSHPSKDDDEALPIREYAKLIGLTPSTILTYIHNNRLKSAHKDAKGRWLVNKSDRPVDWDLRTVRKARNPKKPKIFRRPKDGSAADVAEYITRKQLFTSPVAPYIHTYTELDYYVKHSYHEVFWLGRPALIIDVNPDYISSITGKSNRELMMAGRAPVVPNRQKEEYVFHIHHVGQHSSSPYVIIPEYDHNSKGLSSALHQAKPNTELHGPDFEARKKQFWRKYLEEYDKAGKFSKIPYLNQKSR